MQPAHDREQRPPTGSALGRSEEESGAERGGPELLRGVLRCEQEGASWRLGDVELASHLARYRGRCVMIVIAPLGKSGARPGGLAVEPTDASAGESIGARASAHLACDICGCALDDLGDCPRCRLRLLQASSQLRARIQREAFFHEIDRIVEQHWRNWGPTCGRRGLGN